MSQLDNPNVVAVNQPTYTSLGVGFSSFPFMSPCINSGGNLAQMPPDNTVYVLQLVVPSLVIIANVAISVTGASGTTTVDMGLYDLSGNRLFHAPFTVVTTGIMTQSVTPFTLQPGIYYYCWTGTSTGSMSLFANGGLDNDSCLIFNGIGTITLSAANAATNGVLPATLGALTSANLTSAALNRLPPTLFCMGA